MNKIHTQNKDHILSIEIIFARYNQFVNGMPNPVANEPYPGDRIDAQIVSGGYLSG